MKIRTVPCSQADERTDVHDEANSRFLQFFGRALPLAAERHIYMSRSEPFK